jgi:hemerythrin-like domain-containing protein
VTESERDRLVAWNRELVAAHQRLRQTLARARDALDARSVAPVRADLLLYCQGFCAALSRHHVSEDAALLPELSARYPVLRPAIAKLKQDHEMIASLLRQLDDSLSSAASSAAPPSEVALQLHGVAAIMESHFRYEERQLLSTLSALELDADPREFLGPL